MDFKVTLKELYLKLSVFSLVSLLFLILYIFSLKFYSQKLIKQIENIRTLQEEIIKNQEERSKELKLKQITNFIQQKTGKELPAILFETYQKLNRDFESTKSLFLKKFDKEGWKITNSTFSPEEKKMSLSFSIAEEDMKKFFDFLIDEALVIKIENFDLSKNGKIYDINISFNLASQK